MLKPGVDYSSYTDWNLITEPGIYSLMNDLTLNSPTVSYFYPIVFRYGTNTTQIAVPYYFRDSKVYIRNHFGGSWLDWTKVSDGGNADTVDGKHADNFIQNKGVLHNADVNTVKEPGEYYLQNGLNLPELSSGFLKVEPGYDKNYVKQTYIKYNSNITYERKLVANVWQAWIKTNTIVTCSNTAPTTFIGHDNQHQVY